jgi:putative restriction endonuclease
MILPVFADDGTPIRATCVVNKDADKWSVLIESRGGTRGTANERNADYSAGFHLILRRLADAGAILEDALVESAHLLDRGLSAADRRLATEELSYPQKLDPGTIGLVEQQLRRAQADVGTQRIKGGGNTTRRVRLNVRMPEDQQLPAPFADYITGTRAIGSLTDYDVQAVAQRMDAEGNFQPDSIVDARKRALASIAKRQGQPRFRRALLEAYAFRCPISSCDAVDVLEAAHIIGYAGPATNHVQNGLLLRADLHTLFDRGFLGIDPGKWRVVIHPSIRATVYETIHDTPFALPNNSTDWPNPGALIQHRRSAGLAPSA